MRIQKSEYKITEGIRACFCILTSDRSISKQGVRRRVVAAPQRRPQYSRSLDPSALCSA
jgi:hypothetical protein